MSWFVYEVPAAIQEDIEPASVIPSSKTCPFLSSRYELNCSESTGSYF